ncbi:MAG: hypothetical protein WBI42_03045 [Candidatus Hydrothermia bacterium]
MLKKLTLFFLSIFILCIACAPRKYKGVEEINIEKVRQNLRDIYFNLSSATTRGEFLYSSQNFEVRGSFVLSKNDNNWHLILQNPLKPYIFTVNEDTFPVCDFIENHGDLPFEYRTEGNNIIGNFEGTPFLIEIRNSLPYLITSEKAQIALVYKGKNISQLKLSGTDFSLIMKFTK